MATKASLTDENTQLVFNINKVRYGELDKIFTDEEISNTKLITFYLDSNKVFEFLRSDYHKGISDAIINEKLTYNLAAEFFNFIGHYRRYFLDCNIKTRFVLLHSNKDLMRAKVNPLWNSKYNEYTHPSGEKFLDFVINSRIKPLAVCLPDIHVISAPDYESFKVCRSVYPYLLDLNSVKRKDHMKVIISSDPSMYQLAALMSNCSILKANNKAPRRIYAHEIFEELTRDYKNPMKRIQPNLLPYYLTLMGNAGIEPINKSLKKKKVLTMLSENNVTSLEELHALFYNEIKQDFPTVEMLKERQFLFDISLRSEKIPNAFAVDLINAMNSRAPDNDATYHMVNKYFENKVALVNLL